MYDGSKIMIFETLGVFFPLISTLKNIISLILASFSFFSISTTAAFTSQHQILSQDFHGSAIMKTKDNKNMKKSDYCVTPGCVKGGLISEDNLNLAPSSKKSVKSLSLKY